MYEAEVQAGIALLDEKGPEGWRDRINLGNLRMYSAQDCVLGQIYGFYWDGVKALGFGVKMVSSFSGIWYIDDDPGAYDYGFKPRTGDFVLLEEAWKAALSK